MFFSSATLAWMLLIFYLSSLTDEEVGSALSAPPESVTSMIGGTEDQSVPAHLLLYIVLVWMALSALQSWRDTIDRPHRWVLVAAAFAVLYGISDEYHQSFVAGRNASLLDVGFDALGSIMAATVGYGALMWWARNRKTTLGVFNREPIPSPSAEAG